MLVGHPVPQQGGVEHPEDHGDVSDDEEDGDEHGVPLQAAGAVAADEPEFDEGDADERMTPER